MKLFEGKTPAEKNKLYAALGLGALALIAITYALYSTFSTPVRRAGDTTTKSSPTPKKTDDKVANPNAPNTSGEIQSPAQVRQEDILFALTPIDYRPFGFTAPEATRNIFAFDNPADRPPVTPTPYQVPVIPTVKPPKPTPTPTPAPPPPLLLSYVNPAAVFARTGDFTLEVIGDRFTEDSKIVFNGSELPTRFLGAQRLAATVSAAFITAEGAKQVLVRTPDGGLYSNPFILTVQAPPVPSYQFVGFIGRKRYNNDTAVLYNKTKKDYMNVRLNDTARLSDNAGNLFRVVNLNANEVIVEDTQLKIRHSLKYQVDKPAGGTGSGNNAGGFVPGSEFGQPGMMPNPNFQQFPQSIPGIPDNIPRYNPNQPNPTLQQQQKDQKDQKKYDDEDDEDN